MIARPNVGRNARDAAARDVGSVARVRRAAVDARAHRAGDAREPRARGPPEGPVDLPVRGGEALEERLGLARVLVERLEARPAPCGRRRREDVVDGEEPRVALRVLGRRRRRRGAVELAAALQQPVEAALAAPGREVLARRAEHARDALPARALDVGLEVAAAHARVAFGRDDLAETAPQVVEIPPLVVGEVRGGVAPEHAVDLGRERRASRAPPLGRVPLVSADVWTGDHLSERSRSTDVLSGTRARRKVTWKRHRITLSRPRRRRRATGGS